MKRLFCISLLFILVKLSDAQFENPELKLILNAYFSNDTVLPFWMVANQYGKVPDHSPAQVAELGFRSSGNKVSGCYTLDYGLDAGFLHGTSSELHAQEYYIRLNYKRFSFRIGAMEDSLRYHGISSTNGNSLYSNNSRPMPGLELSTRDWLPVPYTKNYFKVKFLYSESLTRDIRYVQGTKVHRKYAYGLFGGDLPVNIYFGLNHFVQWGGVSRDTTIGDLNPDGFIGYIKNIFPSAGSDSTNPNDYLNASGNHLGSYDLGFIIDTKKARIKLYHETLAEDNSGLQLENWRDGITGLFIDFNKQGIVGSFMYEFCYTMHQSGEKHGLINGVFYRGNDNYFNNNIYRSGWTHFGKIIGLPMFTTSELSEDGYITAIVNNRIVAHHFGIEGSLHKGLKYSALLVRSRNYGTYRLPYNSVRKNTSIGLVIKHQTDRLSAINIACEIAVDLLHERNVWGFSTCFSYTIDSKFISRNSHYQ